MEKNKDKLSFGEIKLASDNMGVLATLIDDSIDQTENVVCLGLLAFANTIDLSVGVISEYYVSLYNTYCTDGRELDTLTMDVLMSEESQDVLKTLFSIKDLIHTLKVSKVRMYTEKYTNQNEEFNKWYVKTLEAAHDALNDLYKADVKSSINDSLPRLLYATKNLIEITLNLAETVLEKGTNCKTKRYDAFLGGVIFGVTLMIMTSILNIFII